MFIVRASAKVNLTLDVLGRDESGYHRIQTILHEVPELFDELIFEEADELVLKCDDSTVPTDDTNTILKAARLLQQHANVTRGARITLKKNIPLQSGLGGPASNAATTIKALNQLWELHLDEWTLRNLSAQIGMDVPFFITGGAAIGMHYGEQIEHLPTLDRLRFRIEIIETNVPVSTPDAYTQLDLTHCGQRNHDTGVLYHLLKGDAPSTDGETSFDAITPLLHNDFEAQFFSAHPELRKKYPDAHLTGTGGALFRLAQK